MNAYTVCVNFKLMHVFHIEFQIKSSNLMLKEKHALFFFSLLIYKKTQSGH